MNFEELHGLKWDDIPIIAIDTETSGFRKEDRIIEIACVMMRGTEVIDEFISLVGGTWIDEEEITPINGITNAMLEDAPLWDDIEGKVLDMILRGPPLCAHSFSFDARMIQYSMHQRWPVGIPTLCTLTLARQQVGRKVKSRSLGQMCDYFGIETGEMHRAKADAVACGKLARKLTAGRVIPELVTKSSEDWSS